MSTPRRDSWFEQALRQAPWRTQTQITSLILALLVILVVIGALYLAQASRTAAAGRRLQELEVQKRTLDEQNSELRAEIAALQSVPRMVSEAQRAGYRPATSADVEYLPIPGEPPPEATEAPLPTTHDIVPQYDETLGSWLSKQLDALRAPITAFFETTFGPEKKP